MPARRRGCVLRVSIVHFSIYYLLIRIEVSKVVNSGKGWRNEGRASKIKIKKTQKKNKKIISDWP